MKIMRNLLLMFILAWPALAWPAAATATPTATKLPAAVDLHADGKLAHDKRLPVLVMFGSASCGHCRRVLRDYLIPMHLNPEYQDKVIMRYVEIDSGQPLKDFSGATTSNRVFARTNNIRVTPTIKLFNAGGGEVSEPLIGLLIADYYAAYLDRAIDEGIARIRSVKSSVKGTAR